MDLYDKYQKSIDFWCDEIFALPEETQKLIFNSEMFLLMAYMSDYATRQIAQQLNQPESIRQLENRTYQLVPVVIPIETENEVEQRNKELNQWREKLKQANLSATKMMMFAVSSVMF